MDYRDILKGLNAGFVSASDGLWIIVMFLF